MRTEGIFRRKSPGEEDSSETPREGSAVQGDAALRALGSDKGPAGAAKTAPAMRPTEPVRKAFDIPPPPSRAVSPPAPASVPLESKKLIVGRDISLNGRISSCDRLVVEGQVEAELHDCHTIEIARTGTFKGAAEIEGAEVSGLYEGSLTVRGNLLIRSTGHVSGTIRYGRLEVEQGGEINGDVKSLEGKAGKARTAAETAPATSSAAD